MVIELASTQDFSLLRGRYSLPAPVWYNPGEAGFPGTAPQIRAIAKIGAAAADFVHGVFRSKQGKCCLGIYL
jgi:hypothetical protein